MQMLPSRSWPCHATRKAHVFQFLIHPSFTISIFSTSKDPFFNFYFFQEYDSGVPYLYRRRETSYKNTENLVVDNLVRQHLTLQHTHTTKAYSPVVAWLPPNFANIQRLNSSLIMAMILSMPNCRGRFSNTRAFLCFQRVQATRIISVSSFSCLF
jgi:hypothetical protein